MAVQYNSENDSWTTWISKLKKEIPEVSKEAEGFFEKMNKVGATITSDTLKPMLESTNGAFDDYIKNNKLADETLIAFLQDTKYGTKDLASYQQYLKESSQSMTLFQRAGKAVGITLKELGAILGSMAAMWAIGEVISLTITGLDQLVNHAKRASEAADEAFSDTNEKVQKNEEEAKSLDELISKYKELKTSENLDVDGRKEIKEIQNDIADLVGVQASNLDLVNGKLDDELSKLNKISKKEAKRAYETATSNYTKSKNATKKAAGDDSYLFMDGYAYVGKKEKKAVDILHDAGFTDSVTIGGNPFNQRVFVRDSWDDKGSAATGADPIVFAITPEQNTSLFAVTTKTMTRNGNTVFSNYQSSSNTTHINTSNIKFWNTEFIRSESTESLNLTLPKTSGTIALISDIPKAGNGTITIDQFGQQSNSFTLNQSDDSTISLIHDDTKLDVAGGEMSGDLYVAGTLGLGNASKYTYIDYNDNEVSFNKVNNSSSKVLGVCGDYFKTANVSVGDDVMLNEYGEMNDEGERPLKRTISLSDLCNRIEKIEAALENLGYMDSNIVSQAISTALDENN